MRGQYGVLFAGLLMCGQAHGETWQTYTYPDPGFAIQFPAVPSVQTMKLKNSVGLTVPVTRYVVRQDGVEYTLSVVNYSGTNADALSTIAETARSFSAKGKVSSDAGARVNGSHGRELTITGRDGSRSDVAIFFVDHYLYTAVGQAFPPHPAERSADTVRFQRSLQFLADDSGFFGLFGGRDTKSSIAASGPDTAGRGTGGGASQTAEQSRATATQHADAACAGKSAGDVVQLDTPRGPVEATCILTARPNP